MKSGGGDREVQEAEMTVDKNRFTKSERKELKRLVGLAYERELAKALESLEENFKQWRKNKISAFVLSELIHKFHNGIARDLWSFYTAGPAELNVKHAIAKGVILKNEISPGILEKLNIIVSKGSQSEVERDAE